MKTYFVTESGSQYVVDHAERVWNRRSNPDSPLVRTPNGSYYWVSDIRVGRSVVLLCPPIVEGAATRVIQTTRVVHLENRDDEITIVPSAATCF
jgi:hypothetical protein